MWFKRKFEDSEVDIESNPVVAIDRRGKYTVFGFLGEQSDEYVACSLEQHAKYLERFRKKIAFKSKSPMHF